MRQGRRLLRSARHGRKGEVRHGWVVGGQGKIGRARQARTGRDWSELARRRCEQSGAMRRDVAGMARNDLDRKEVARTGRPGKAWRLVVWADGVMTGSDRQARNGDTETGVGSRGAEWAGMARQAGNGLAGREGTRRGRDRQATRGLERAAADWRHRARRDEERQVRRGPARSGAAGIVQTRCGMGWHGRRGLQRRRPVSHGD
jgi:hypothetical protein